MKNKETVIYSSYDLYDNYYEYVKEMLINDGISYPTEDEIWNEIYNVDQGDWEIAVKNLKEVLENGIFILQGTTGTWQGKKKAGFTFKTFDELSKAWERMDFIKFYEEDGKFFIQTSHHDGTNDYEVRKLNEKGEEYYNNDYRGGEKDDDLLMTEEYSSSLNYMAKKQKIGEVRREAFLKNVAEKQAKYYKGELNNENLSLEIGSTINTTLGEYAIVMMQEKDNTILYFPNKGYGNEKYLYVENITFDKENNFYQWDKSGRLTSLEDCISSIIAKDDEKMMKFIVSTYGIGYQNLVKSIISYEANITNKELLDEIYREYITDDRITGVISGDLKDLIENKIVEREILFGEESLFEKAPMDGELVKEEEKER